MAPMAGSNDAQKSLSVTDAPQPLSLNTAAPKPQEQFVSQLHPMHQQMYEHAHAHAAMLAHATQHMIQKHIESEKHTEIIHTQIQKHGDKHVFDLFLASSIVLIIMCGVLTLAILLYFGCVSRTCRIVPLRYLCCPCLLLCRKQDEEGTMMSSSVPMTSSAPRGGSRGGGKFRV